MVASLAAVETADFFLWPYPYFMSVWTRTQIWGDVLFMAQRTADPNRPTPAGPEPDCSRHSHPLLMCVCNHRKKKKKAPKNIKGIFCRMGSRQQATSSFLLCLKWSIPGADAGEMPGINELWSWSLGRLWSLAGPLMNLESHVSLMSHNLFDRENATASKDMVCFERYQRRFYPWLATHACTTCLH